MSRNEVGSSPDRGPRQEPRAASPSVSRRTLLLSVGLGVGAVTLTTAGQAVPWLAPLDLFAPRSRSVGPQGLPVNRTSRQAGVTASALDPGWRLELRHGTTARTLTRDALLALPQSRSDLPIACVEGWSVGVAWDGVVLRRLLAEVGAPPLSRVRVTSLERSGAYRVTELPAEYADDPLTLVALGIDGEPLHLEHGYPARLVAPGRPGVLQTKWLRSIEVI
ncbi:molybdopterin-dependent oxidoreductase [Terrabacter sp. NPDC000476]|uniref:molybdopterin-dependent oxidoreductase n=1 Tax=Terrabacter sp. NPDC000476 TaxID=3154258 RepID=UPI003321ED9B